MKSISELKLLAYQQYRNWNDDYSCLGAIIGEDNVFGFFNIGSNLDTIELFVHGELFVHSKTQKIDYALSELYILFNSKESFESFGETLSREDKISDGFDEPFDEDMQIWGW